MNVLNNFNIHEDFFDSNPQLQIPFSHIQASHPEPSDFMWSIALFADPDSKFSNTSQEFRQQLISEDYYDPDWKDPATQEAISLYEKLVLTKAEKFLVDWEKKLEERANFIASLPYNEQTYELLDSMMAKTERMWKQYMNCLKDVEDEKQQHTFGGAQESATEQGLL